MHSKGEFVRDNITPSFRGSSYLSLIVRPDSTGENISQKLFKPLLKDTYYSFQIHLAKPAKYHNRVRVIKDSKEELAEIPISFANAVKLQVWGFNEVCEAGEVLYETAAIDHTDWQSYDINFQPKKDYYHLAFIPVFAEDRAYAGCILIDECSPIFETDASYRYSYEMPDIDSLFLKYEENFKESDDEMLVKGAFVIYYPNGNKNSYWSYDCLLYTSPSPRDATLSRMPSSA